MNFLRRRSVSLRGARAFRFDDRTVEIEYEDGSRRQLNVRDVKNAEAAIAWASDELLKRRLVPMA
jgi:hypothetical protein